MDANVSLNVTEMLVIGKLAPRWNVPIIAHMSGDDALSDRSVFPTLGSVALTSASEMARATMTFLQLNNWDEVRMQNLLHVLRDSFTKLCTDRLRPHIRECRSAFDAVAEEPSQKARY